MCHSKVYLIRDFATLHVKLSTLILKTIGSWTLLRNIFILITFMTFTDFRTNKYKHVLQSWTTGVQVIHYIISNC